MPEVPSNRDSLNWNDPNVPRWLPRALLYAIAAVTLFFVGARAIEALSGFLLTLLVSLFLAFAMEPAVDYLETNGWKRGRATAFVFFILAILATGLILLMVNLVVEQVSSLVDDAPRLVQRGAEWVNARFDTKITTDGVVAKLQEYQGQLATTAGDLGGRVVSVTGSVIGLVFQAFTIVLFSFYMVADGPRMRETVCSVLPPLRQRQVLSLWALSVQKTGGYLYSRLLLAAISALVSGVAFTIIGVPSPVALALWMGVVSQFVPVIGTYIGGALPALIALLNDPVKSLWVMGFIVVYQQLENYLLAPRVSARTMAIHPAVAFGSAIAGGSLLGPIGALLALPAAAIVQAFVSSFLQRYDVVSAEELDPSAAAPEDT